MSRRAFVVGVVLIGVVVSSCGGEDEQGRDVVIKTKVDIAATEGAEPIATGEILEGSTIGAAPFCVGGRIRDTHASADPDVASRGLIKRVITCSDGTLTIGFTPEPGRGSDQIGTWTATSGTGAFEGLRGSGELEVVYGDAESSTRETLTGTVTLG